MKQLIVYGAASQRQIKSIDVSYRDYETTLMDLLLKNGIPVASSCGGDGICQKCVTKIRHHHVLSCQKIIRDIFIDSNLETVSLSYL